MARRRKTAGRRRVSRARRTRKMPIGGNAASNTKPAAAKGMDDSITGDDTAGATLIGIADKAASAVASAADDVLGPALDEASDAVFGDMTEKPFSEAAPQLTAELQENAEFLKNAASDPKVRAALHEYGEALGDAVDTASEVITPVIDEAITDTFNAMDQAGEKVAIGTVNTGLNLFKAAVAEIPVVGAVVDLGLAGAQAMNYTAQAASPMIVSGAKTMAKAMDAVDEALPEIGAIQDKMEDAASGLEGALSSIEGEAEAAMSSAKQAAEGAVSSVKQEAEGAVGSAVSAASKQAENVGKEAVGAASSAISSVSKQMKEPTKSKDTNAKADAKPDAKGGARRKAKRTARRISRSLERFTRRRK